MAKPVSPVYTPGAIGTEGCAALWAFNNDYVDLSPNGRDCSAVGTPTWGTGTFGPEVGGFSNVNHILGPDDTPFRSRPIAITFLATFPGSISDWVTPIDHGIFGAGWGFLVQIGNLYFYAANAYNANPAVVALPAAGDHIVTAHSKADGSIDLWLDGTLVNTSAGDTTAFADSTIRIGWQSSGFGPWPGNIAAMVINSGGTLPNFATLHTDWLGGTFSIMGGGAGPLDAGTIAFESSGPGGITVNSVTAASGGTGSRTYQWRRSENGGAYSNLAGKTAEDMGLDATATTAGVAYRYVRRVTDGAAATADTDPTAALYAYSGGNPAGGGVSIFTSPFIRG
jgi:hypothetical protein